MSELLETCGFVISVYARIFGGIFISLSTWMNFLMYFFSWDCTFEGEIAFPPCKSVLEHKSRSQRSSVVSARPRRKILEARVDAEGFSVE
jgi:hypothetical protein